MKTTESQDKSPVEVQNISKHGIWVLIKDKEYFLPHEDFPWFQDAKVGEVCNVQLLHGDHLYWPDLDVDLEIGSIEDPKKYPLVARKRD
ncbi:MAG: DUF2442 domain-containing protein [Planctomycetes bacterium]|nr:DUF2442 domain-containing protein [Planctomycetota bacterium]